MQPVRRDDGAVAVLVAILAVVLFGFGAFVIDVGAMYYERRELQAGADAAALAVARGCSIGTCGDPLLMASDYADANAHDEASHVDEVCGEGSPDLESCDPPLDIPGVGYVAVRTETGDRTAEGVLPPAFARVLKPGYPGATVRSVAVANWGSPGGLRSVLPFAFGNCEWEYYTNSGLTYPGTIVPPSWPTRADGTSLEATVSLTGGNIACPGTPPGGDSSGGFGWLGDDADKCTEVSVVDGFIGNKTGVGTAGCNYAALVGKTVHVPVFDCQTDLSLPDPDYDSMGRCYGEGPESGASVRYHIAGYATFYVTGISVPGVRVKSMVTGKFPCAADQKCISGFFTTDLAPATGPVTDGPSFGSVAVGLAYLVD